MTSTIDFRRFLALALVALVVLVFGPVLLFGVATFDYGMPMAGSRMPMWGGSTGVDGGLPFLMPIFGVMMPLLFLAALVGGGYLLFQVVATADRVDPALEELRLAYARGDLSDEEYETRRETLERES